MRRIGESTLVDIDDAGIQSREVAVTEADELFEKEDEPEHDACSSPSWQRYGYGQGKRDRGQPR